MKKQPLNESRLTADAKNFLSKSARLAHRLSMLLLKKPERVDYITGALTCLSIANTVAPTDLGNANNLYNTAKRIAKLEEDRFSKES
jgi:hypothetical protein